MTTNTATSRYPTMHIVSREPKGATMLAARLARAYPSLSAYSAATLAEELCAIERAQRRHAERCCSGEDGGYVRIRSLGRDDDNAGQPIVREHDPDAEERAGVRILKRVRQWKTRLAGLGGHAVREGTHARPLHELTGSAVELLCDQRGAVLKVQLPGETEAVAV